MGSLITLQTLVARLREEGASPALIDLRADAVEARPFSTVADEIECLAGGLVSRGVAHGEPVGIYAEGAPEWVVAFLAIVTAGAVAVPFDVSLKKGALADQIKDAGCRRIFVSGQQATDLGACDLGHDTVLYLLGEASDGEIPGLVAWRHLVESTKSPLPSAEAGDQAALFYTSGTTGRPKGVPLTHANLVANINSLVAEQVLKPGSRVLMPLPPHHVYPLVVGILAPLAAGAAIVFPAGMSGPAILDALHRGKADVMIGVPRLYTGLVEAINARLQDQGRIAKLAICGLSLVLDCLPGSLRRLVGRMVFRRVREALGPHLWLLASGGARLDEETWRTLERFGWTVLTGYGLTETAPILTFNTLRRSKIGSAGRPLSDVEVRIANPNSDGVGAIEGRGPNIFSGYRNRPEETAAAFTQDGWFRTGDLGYLDSDGYLFIVGREKELIVLSDGKNIFPEAVETVYGESPLIKEIAVLEQGGGLVGLVVPDMEGLRNRGAESAVQLVHDEIRDLSPRLLSHQRLSGHVLTRSRLPRTTIGKLQRHLLPDLYRGAKDGLIAPERGLTADDLAILATSPAKELWKWLEGRFPDTQLSLDVSPQLDLGIDSLGWTGLSLEIEDRFGVSLTDDRIARIVSLRDLVTEVAEAVAIPATSDKSLSRPPLELTPTSLLQRLANTMLYGVFWLAMRLLFRLKVDGLNNIPTNGPVVITPNHASWLDPVAIAASLPSAQIRRTRFAGWTGLLFDNAVSRAFSWAARVFPVDPDRAASSSITLGRATLDQGEILVWFPEGRRTRTGNLLAFQPGIGALIQKTDIPVVPAYIAGTFEAAPAGRWMPRLKPIKVCFGVPKTAEDLAIGENRESGMQEIAAALQDAVAALKDSGERRGN